MDRKIAFLPAELRSGSIAWLHRERNSKYFSNPLPSFVAQSKHRRESPGLQAPNLGKVKRRGLSEGQADGARGCQPGPGTCHPALVYSSRQWIYPVRPLPFSFRYILSYTMYSVRTSPCSLVQPEQASPSEPRVASSQGVQQDDRSRGSLAIANRGIKSKPPHSGTGSSDGTRKPPINQRQ